MAWERLATDDPRAWTKGESIEGELLYVPEANTLGGFVSIRTKTKDIIKFCPSRLYGGIHSVPVGTTIKIICGGKIKQRGRVATWEFEVYADTPD